MSARRLAHRLVAALAVCVLCACGEPASEVTSVATSVPGITPQSTVTQSSATEPVEVTPEDTAVPTETAEATVDSGLQSQIDAARADAYEGRLEDAIAQWRTIVEQSEGEARIEHVLELARLYIRAGKTEMAIAQASWASAVEAPDDLHAQALGLLGTAQESTGDWNSAADTLRAYVASEPAAAPYVWWHIANAYKAVGDVGRQITALEEIDATTLDSAFRAEVLSELASAYRANSDPNSALKVYDEILSFAELPDYRALIEHYKGETLREASHEQEAVVTFYRVANENPDTFAASLALKELAALPESATIEASQTLTDTAQSLVLTDLTRGEIHYYSQEYDLAQEYLNYYLQDEPERGGSEAHYYLGLTFAKKGQYDDALVHLNAAIDNAGDQDILADAWLAKAWTIGLSGSDPSAFYYEFYVNNPGHARAPEALWDAAESSEEAANWTQAALYYGTLAEQYPSDTRADDAAFREGLAHYAAHDAYTASTTWRERLDATSDVNLRVRLIVWIGLAAREADQLEQADVYWQEAVRIAPDTYYGLRAADLLQHTMPRLASGLSAEITGATLTQAEWDSLDAWVISWAGEEPTVDLTADPRYAEAQALQSLGWSSETTAVLNRLQQAIKDSPQAILALAEAGAGWGEQATVIWCGARLEKLARAAGATVPDDLRRLAYPDDYASLVQEYATYYDLDPLLMLAMIRQESLFDPDARSSAGALGLAQIMPDTGRWIASQIGETDYADSRLLRPYVNLRYSAWYYELLLNLYDRDWMAALVAYNAGPGNLATWTHGVAIEDHDLFFETLPSQQAQDYVRYISEQYSRYRQIYRPAAP